MILFICIALLVSSLGLQIRLSNSFPNLNGLDERQVKDFLCLIPVLWVVGTALFQHGLDRIKNRWAMFFLGFLCIHRYIAPNTDIALLGIHSDGVWQYQELFLFILFTLFTLSIARLNFTPADITRILKTLFWISFLNACYMIVQGLGIDPWLQLETDHDSIHATQGFVSGTFTHPHFAALFLALTFPIVLHLKKFWAIPFIGLALWSADSQASYAIILGETWLYFLLLSRWRVVYVGLSVIVLSLLTYSYFDVVHISDSGRVESWKLLLSDLVDPVKLKASVLLTGYSLGSYRYFFPIFHPDTSTLVPAHNDYLELLFKIGLVGVTFLFLGVCSFLWNAFQSLRTHLDKCILVIICGFLVAATVSYPFQIEPFRFIFCFLVGLTLSRWRL